jgi:uncharacterized protein (TIGR04222 family)
MSEVLDYLAQFLTNPFNLSGPKFLQFFVLLVIALHVLLLFARTVAHFAYAKPATNESAPVAAGGGPYRSAASSFDPLDVDPYRLAYLRGGPREMAMLAVVSLTDRGLLTVSRGMVHRSGVAELHVRRPIEREVLGQGTTFNVASAVDAVAKGEAARRMGAELERLGFVAPSSLCEVLVNGARACVLGLAGSRIVISLANGRTNVLFLVILGLAAPLSFFWASKVIRTSTGTTHLRLAQTLLGDLKHRVAQLAPGGGSNELSFAVGAFGTGLLAVAAGGAYASAFALPTSTGTPSDSDGTSCGSSSCSSGCGGGGCGGCGGGD